MIKLKYNNSFKEKLSEKMMGMKGSMINKSARGYIKPAECSLKSKRVVSVTFRDVEPEEPDKTIYFVFGQDKIKICSADTFYFGGHRRNLLIGLLTSYHNQSFIEELARNNHATIDYMSALLEGREAFRALHEYQERDKD